MVREGRVFISPTGKPEYGIGYYVTAYEVGAQVAAASSGTTATVRAGHGFAANDKLIVGTDATLYRRVVSVTTTTLVLDSAISLADGDLLVNLGQDTGATAPNYDGNGLAVYTDMDYANQATYNTVLTDLFGKYRYYHQGIPRWELVRSTSGPVALYMDAGTNQPNVINVFDFGATGNGITDDTAAVQFAISASGPNSVIYFPQGDYNLSTGGIVIAGHKVSLKGDGRGATLITFQPSSAATLFTFNSGVTSTILYQPTIRDLTLVGGGTAAKTAFKFVNCSGAIIDQVSCTGWNGGAASKFIVSQGREQLMVRDTHASGCDTVVHIQANPDTSNGLVDCDLFNFHNCVFGCESTSDGQTFLVDSGVYLSNFSCTGMNSWSGGKYGFYYVDTTAPTFAINVVFDNVRWEQCTSTAGYGWYISHSLSLSGMALNNCQCSCSGGGNGLYLRNVDYATLQGFRFDAPNTSKTMLDIDTTCSNVVNMNPINVNSYGVETVTCTTYLKVVGNVTTGLGLSGSSTDTFTMDTGNNRGFYWFTKAGAQTGLVAYNASDTASAAAYVKAYNGTQTVAMAVYPPNYGTAPYAGNAMLAADGTQKLFLGYAGARVGVIDGTGFGVGVDAATATADVNGSLRLRSTSVSVTGNDNVTTAARSVIGLTNTSGANTITLSAPSSVDGQILVLHIVAITAGSINLADSGNCNLSAAWTTPGVGDTLTLMAVGAVWVELARSNN